MTVSDLTTANVSGARDLMVFRGEKYWSTPEDVIREVHQQGLSVRIPRNTVPEGMVRGLSRIALAHIKAVMAIEHGTEDELRAAFANLHDPDVDAVLARTYEHAPSRWLEMPDTEATRAIFEQFGVKFSPGIFAFCYWTGCAYYLKPGEDEAPRDLAKKGVQAVRGINPETGEILLPVATEHEEED
ncbi:MAG: hypothetical protein FJ009_12750 [Chloroflexi bacterium]|nr:hypothetical protein [Chloroflexota bacterium]